jgi:nicotinamide-nucleotide amidase
MHAIILSVGDELTLGQTIDTNSPWLSQQLATIGLPVRAHVTVPDDREAIRDAISEYAWRCEVLLVSGGIGPTPDDLTRHALADYLHVPLELNHYWLDVLKDFFAKRGRPMPEMNTIQAMIPRGANIIENGAGTAAGIHASVTNGHIFQSVGDDINKPVDAPIEDVAFFKLEACQVFVMPGVPKEMKLMFERSVLPMLRERSSGAVILAKTLHTFGQGESTVAELLGPLMDRSRNPTVGTTVSAGIVSVRINARFPSKDEAQHHLDATVKECYTKLGDLIFGEDDTTIGQAIHDCLSFISNMFKASHTIATAESCTGGLLAKLLTDTSGSSSYFTHGWVTYSNEAKTALLGVPESLIRQHGAVSEQVVIAMALGALERSGATDALAISGVAGPTGGTPAKPVGTVCIAHAFNEGPHVQHWSARTFLFPGDREMIRDRSAKMALTMLRYHLLGKQLPL